MAATDANVNREILTGDFGLITTIARSGAASAGAIASGDWVEVAAKKDGSDFGAVAVGDLFYNPTASAITTSGGDTQYALTEQILGFATGWSIELARNPIDTTALQDEQSTSVFGRPTTSGTINGYLVANDTNADAALQRFVDTYKISAAGVATLVAKSAAPLAFIGYTIKAAANRPFIEAYYLPEMDIGTINIGSEVGGLIDFNAPLALRGGSLKRYSITLPTS